MDEELRDAMQRRLATNRRDRSPGRRGRNRPLLLGLAHDAASDRLAPTHGIRRGLGCRYDVSHRPVAGGSRAAPDARRVPVADPERLIVRALLRLLTDPPGLLGHLGEAEVLPAGLPEQHRLIVATRRLGEGWSQFGLSEQRAVLHRPLRRVDVTDEEVILHVHPRGPPARRHHAVPPDA